MSELINQHWEALKSISSANKPQKIKQILENSDPSLLLSISEIFLNIGNLTIELTSDQREYFSRHLETVQRLIDIKGSLLDQKFILKNHVVVRKGVACALKYLEPSRK